MESRSRRLVMVLALAAIGCSAHEDRAPVAQALIGDTARARSVSSRSGLELPADAAIVDVIDDGASYRFRYVTGMSPSDVREHCDEQLRGLGFKRLQSWRVIKGEPTATRSARFDDDPSVAIARIREGKGQTIVEIERWHDGAPR